MDVDASDGLAAWSPTFCQIVVQLRPGLFVFHFEGVLPGDVFAPTMGEITKAAEGGSGLILIGDAETCTGYDTAFRERWTSWIRQHRTKLSEVHLFVQLPLLRMGVQVVNLLSGHVIQTYSGRAAFRGAVANKWPDMNATLDRLSRRATALIDSAKDGAVR